MPSTGVETSKCLADVEGHDSHPGKGRKEKELKKNRVQNGLGIISIEPMSLVVCGQHLFIVPGNNHRLE